jgi:hypothetical protein
MISRGFSFRSSKHISDDVDYNSSTSTYSFSSWGITRRPSRGASEGGHSRADHKHSLPNTRPTLVNVVRPLSPLVSPV